MTSPAAILPLDAARRTLATFAIQTLPERMRTEWNDALIDSARDMAIGWRVHRKASNRAAAFS